MAILEPSNQIDTETGSGYRVNMAVLSENTFLARCAKSFAESIKYLVALMQWSFRFVLRTGVSVCQKR